MIAEDDRDEIWLELFSAVTGGNVFDRTLRVCVNGEEGWRNIRAVRIPYADSEKPVIIAIITDVTDFKRQEAVLVTERERMALALENTTISFWDFFHDRSEIVQTEHSREIHGYPLVIENVPQSLIDSGYVYPDDIANFIEMYDCLYKGEKNVSGIFRVKCEGQTDYHYEHIRYTNIFDENGHPYRAVGFSEQINMLYSGVTGKSVINLNEIASSLAVAKIVGVFKIKMDEGFTIVYANNYYYNIMGYDDRADMEKYAELKGLRCVHADSREHLSKVLRGGMASKSQNCKFDMKIITKQGDIKDVLVWGTFSKDEEETYLLGCMIDISEQVAQKEMIEYQNSMLLAAVKHADLYYWDYDIINDRSVQCSRAQEELGLPALITNYPQAWIDHKVIVPEHVDEYIRMHEKLKEGVPEAEMDVQMSDGKWYRVRYTNTFDENGRPVKALGTAQNIQSMRSTINTLVNSERSRAEISMRAQLDYIYKMSAIETFEVDIETRTMHVSNGTTTRYMIKNNVIENVPESMIEDGVIHEDSAETFRELYDDIFAGKSEGNAIIKVKKTEDEYVFTRLSFKNLYNDKGQPYKAIGIAEETENITDVRIRFEQEEKMKLLIRHDKVAVCKINLSTGLVEDISALCCELLEQAENLSADSFFAAVAAMMQNNEDKIYYEEAYTKEKIIESYRKGKDWFCEDFRIIHMDREIKWVSHTIQVLTNTHNGDIYAFIYIRSVNDKKKRELALPFKPEFDITGTFYNKKTMAAVADMCIKSIKHNRSLCALVILKIVNMAEITERFPISSLDRMMLSINRKLRYTLENRYVTARVGDDKILIFMDSVPSEQWMYECGEYILQVLNRTAFFTTKAEQYAMYHMGTSILTAEKADYEALYSLALSAVERADSLKPYVQYYSNTDSVLEAGVKLIPYSDIKISAVSEESLNSSDRVTPMFLQCAEELLVERDISESVDIVLKKLGEFFHAERAYVIEVNEAQKTLDNTYEWCAEGVSAEIDNLKDVSLSLVPNFMRAYEQKSALWITDMSVLCETERVILTDQGITSLFVVPYVSEGLVTGFVGIDNPTENMSEKMVLNTVTHFLMNEIFNSKSLAKSLYTSRYDIQSGALSRNSYVEFITENKLESLSSMGVLLADINGLKTINSRYGNQRGDEVVREMVLVLQEHFGDKSVYRYAGGLFLVLMPDITYEAFSSEVMSVRAAYAKIEEYEISVGSTWSDKLESIDRLVTEADEMLAADKRESGGKAAAKKKAQQDKILTGLMDSIDSGRCIAYLQPKVISETLEICGAEALVRIDHPENGIISPGRFIPFLEEAGLVRYIDFFMFEEVLRMQDKWKREGHRLFPISLNFSRATMLEPGVVDTMLKIAEKYDVPHSMIEIEITESLGSMESESMRKIGNSIMQEGFCLSLDDFGAKYSNLAILSWLDFSVLKLDKSLIDRITSSEMTRSIIGSVISLCEKYKIKVVAEGVETEPQLQKLRELGCYSIQGYIINKPIPISDFEHKYLKK